MTVRKTTLTAIAAIALGVASLPLSSSAFAAANTAGLAALTLQGVGIGSISSTASSCTAPTTSGNVTLDCAGSDTCECLTGADSLVGNQGFAKGSLTFTLIVDETNDTTATGGLTTSTFGFCYPATGLGTIANSNGKNAIDINVSGLACPTSSGVDVFSGAYVVSGGKGKYSSASGGAGAINGSQDGSSGASQASVTGSIQPTAP